MFPLSLPSISHLSSSYQSFHLCFCPHVQVSFRQIVHSGGKSVDLKYEYRSADCCWYVTIYLLCASETSSNSQRHGRMTRSTSNISAIPRIPSMMAHVAESQGHDQLETVVQATHFDSTIKACFKYNLTIFAEETHPFLDMVPFLAPRKLQHVRYVFTIVRWTQHTLGVSRYSCKSSMQ